MKRHVILAHELGISHILCALVGAPPALPIRIAFAIRIRPFLSTCNVFNRRVEPDVEHLALHARPILGAALHRHAPVQIARDAAILQTIAVMKPLLRDRGRQHRPIILAVDPLRELIFHLALAQVEMFGLAHFQVSRA